MSLASKDRDTARKKGFLAGAAAAGSVALIATGAPVLGVVALVPAAYLVRDWFMYRARRGMRF